MAATISASAAAANGRARPRRQLQVRESKVYEASKLRETQEVEGGCLDEALMLNLSHLRQSKVVTHVNN